MQTITDGTAKFIVRDKRMQALVDMFYPVGTVYATTASTKPEFMNYGTWEQFAQGRTLVGAGTGTDNNNLAMTFNAGATGGEYKHQLSVGEMPAHSHTRGTMEITGMIRVYNEYNYNNAAANTNAFTGAFNHTGNAEYATNTNMGTGSYDGIWDVKFNASKSWTGNTSSVGENAAHDNLQPYTAVYYFKRVS